MVKRVAVEIGQRLGVNVEIVNGLQEGDQVVVSGLQKVRDGIEVEILPPPGGLRQPLFLK